MEGFKAVQSSDIRTGDEIIVERKRYRYHDGVPIPSQYIRAMAYPHRTVAGPTMILRPEPSIEFPEIAPWALGWTYASNDATHQMWRRES